MKYLYVEGKSMFTSDTGPSVEDLQDVKGGSLRVLRLEDKKAPLALAKNGDWVTVDDKDL